MSTKSFALNLIIPKEPLNSKKLTCQELQNESSVINLKNSKKVQFFGEVKSIGFSMKVAIGWNTKFNSFFGTYLEHPFIGEAQDKLMIVPTAGLQDIFTVPKSGATVVTEIDGKKANWKVWSKKCGKELYGEIKFQEVPVGWNEWHKILYVTDEAEWPVVKAMIYSMDLWEKE